MKFDIVVSNPPYQKGGWKKFLEKMSQISSGYVCVICPDPTKNDSNFGKEIRTILSNAGIYKKLDCTDYFPEVSSGKISYFLCSKNYKGEFVFEDDGIYTSIRNKIVPNSAFVLRGFQNPKGVETSLSLDEEYRFPIIFSASKIGLELRYIRGWDYKISIKHQEKLCGPFFIINRFFGKNADDPVYMIDEIQNYSISSNVLIIKSSEEETIEGFRSLYGSKLYRFFIGKMRGKAFDIQQYHLASLPKLDLTRTWTDQELYAYFGLTDEEINYIEANVR